MNRAHLGTDGLLEMIPLTRDEHRALDLGDTWTNSFICANAPAYFRRMYRAYRNTDFYLGPPERVAEIRRQVEDEDARIPMRLGS